MAIFPLLHPFESPKNLLQLLAGKMHLHLVISSAGLRFGTIAYIADGRCGR
jgi:hypothetical protein